MAIFPLTQLALRAMGRPALPRGHPMSGLAMQVAFVVPLTLPIVGAVALFRLEWFYPAFMVALGAHYLPFVFLRGMWQYAVLAGALVLAGLALALYVLGGWLTGVVLLAFAFVGRSALLRDGAWSRARPSGGRRARRVERPAVDVMASCRYVGRMDASHKRATVYFDPELHRALRLKAAETERSVSDLVNEAVRLSLSEDATDLLAIEERRAEPEVDFETVVKDLRRRGQL